MWFQKCNFQFIIFYWHLQIFYVNAIAWMPQDLTDDKPILVQLTPSGILLLALIPSAKISKFDCFIHGININQVYYHTGGMNKLRYQTRSLKNTGWSLHWRHNDHEGVLNHQPHGWLLNRLFRRRSKKTSKLRVTGLCVGNSPGPVNSPHKGPVTRKMIPFDDVSMASCCGKPFHTLTIGWLW